MRVVRYGHQAGRRGGQALLMLLADWQQVPQRAETRIALDPSASRGAPTVIYATGKWGIYLNTKENILNQRVLDGIVR